MNFVISQVSACGSISMLDSKAFLEFRYFFTHSGYVWRRWMFTRGHTNVCASFHYHFTQTLCAFKPITRSCSLFSLYLLCFVCVRGLFLLNIFWFVVCLSVVFVCWFLVTRLCACDACCVLFNSTSTSGHAMSRHITPSVWENFQRTGETNCQQTCLPNSPTSFYPSMETWTCAYAYASASASACACVSNCLQTFTRKHFNFPITYSVVWNARVLKSTKQILVNALNETITKKYTFISSMGECNVARK